MISLHEEITVPRTIEDCFRYVADFRNAVEWDATATRADKITDGPVGLGSKFDLDCKAGPGSVNLEYEIEEYQPWHSIVLRGRGRFFEVVDTIVFSEQGDHTHIDYTAEFHYRAGLEKIARRFETGMRAMGASSLKGLRIALQDNNPTPATLASSKRADAMVLPGLAMFTRWGHTRGQRHWLPMTRFMDGVHVVLTGASSGLGLATATSLAEAGADLTLVIRDPGKEEALRDHLLNETGRADIAIEFAELSSMTETQQLAERLIAAGKPIDVLINNAGALFNDYGETEEGLERSFALLLLGPWFLTRLLHPLLANHERAARVINVVSGGMYTEPLVCKRLVMKPDRYHGATAYARAKRALSVLTEQWANDWAADNIVVNAMHPGWADTPGVKSALPTFRKITQRVLRNSEEGADTIVWLARATEADKLSGKLFLDREARTPYLVKKHREKPGERERLPELLVETLHGIGLELVSP